MMKHFLLFAKGVCMGIADVIPGVSGGTMALVLGIYAQLVHAIRSLHLRWLRSLLRWARHGRQPGDWRVFREDVASLNLQFLMVLGTGIIVAIGLGSLFIPSLLERYPEAMRAFFFGLIVASVVVPYRMMQISSKGMLFAVIVFFIAGLSIGYVATNPGRQFEAAQQWVNFESTGETLKEIARRAPSAWTTEAVFHAPQNQILRNEIVRHNPQLADWISQIEGGYSGNDALSPDKDALKARSVPFDELMIPEGIPVAIPRPAYWFMFAAGAIAICAMILPGISGSYILLILGMYFFVLNALKGSIQTLASGNLPVGPGLFVILFIVGAAIGLLSFARLLSYLLRKHRDWTLALLLGLMLGCLRGIWPFQQSVEGRVVNVIPSHVDGTVITVIVVAIIGVVLVGILSWLGAAKRAGYHREA